MRVQCNSKPSKPNSVNTTGYNGVSLMSEGKYKGQYRARVTVNGKREILGYRPTAVEAANLITDWNDKK